MCTSKVSSTGHLAVPLARRGVRYVEVDLAPSALEKARLRFEQAGLSGLTEFILADATDLGFLPQAGFGLAVDSKFLHMLVVDGDRERYLSGLRRALRPGAWAMFNELYREDTYSGPNASFEQYMEVYCSDLSTVEERVAYNGDTPVTVRIPKIPGRFKDEAGYRSEMEQGGFEVVRFEVLKRIWAAGSLPGQRPVSGRPGRIRRRDSGRRPHGDRRAVERGSLGATGASAGRLQSHWSAKWSPEEHVPETRALRRPIGITPVTA